MFNILSSNKKIYLDYASITPMHMKVLEHIYSLEKKNTHGEYFSTNPSSLHEGGTNAEKILEDSRNIVADYIDAHSDEIYFTGGGTESNNIAIKGIIDHALFFLKTKPHVITSKIEHSSVLKIIESYRDKGLIDVSFLKNDKYGVVDVEDLQKNIREETILVSVMSLNNEIGTAQPIKEISKIIRKNNSDRKSKIFFHVDACQSMVYGISLSKIDIDLLTMDSQKIYGPRGVGALYIKRGVEKNMTNLIIGGGQEREKRSGTQNISGVSGFATALSIMKKERDRFIDHIKKSKNAFINELRKNNIDFSINGTEDIKDFSSHILNISILGIDALYTMFLLNSRGVLCSTKSACLNDKDESYVLSSMGVKDNISLRFSFGLFTSISDSKRAGMILSNIIKSGLTVSK